MVLQSRDDATAGIEDELSSPATTHEEEVDSITNFDIADIDFIGDTDDIDDDTRISSSSANKQLSKRATPSASIGGTASGPQRQSRSMSETMSGWLDKQSLRWWSRGNGRSNQQASSKW